MQKSNKLIHEKSPYLLQHAHNPVDWYPWSEEAFQKAKNEEKPIFLSIGYSTCHWCHVMERESFINSQIADILNESFVSIKVDREERPDVDHVYMQAVMAMAGSGGWPMSVFLTPDLKPFYGGTYFPPEDRWGRPGFITVLNAIRNRWQSGKSQIEESGEELVHAIKKHVTQGLETKELGEATLNLANSDLLSMYDPEFGGFGSAPKFPRSHEISYLLRFAHRTDEKKPLEVSAHTLTQMLKGGIYDHLGGGFHRYSTDERWHVPHFEKMLYDQALITKTYLEAYQITKYSEYARVVRETFDYILRDLKDKQGAFYSAEDADSAKDPKDPHEKSEGAFYIWTAFEIQNILGEGPAAIFKFIFGVEENGNALEDPHNEFSGENILYLKHSIKEAAEHFGKQEDEISQIVSDAKKKMFQERLKRPRPHLDDKILTDWNGLMISSLALGARILNEPRYLEAAKRAADFILTKMKQANRLMHRFRDGEAAIPGFLEDYAFFSLGLIDLYEASFDPEYLAQAKRLLSEMFQFFWDEKEGGFFMTAKGEQELFIRAKELYDGAIPSGNSIALLALLRLSRMTMNSSLEEVVRIAFNYFSSLLASHPAHYTQAMIAFDFLLGPNFEIVIAEGNDGVLSQISEEIHRYFQPNQVLLLRPFDVSKRKKIDDLSPFTKEQNAIQGKTTVYRCKNYACDLPITDLARLQTALLESKVSR